MEQEGQHPLSRQRDANFRLFPVMTGSFPTNVIAHLHSLSMDLTVGWTVGPTTDSTVGCTIRMTVKFCKHWFDSQSNYWSNCGNHWPMELPPAKILIPLERQLIALQLCHWQFLYDMMKICSRLLVFYCRNCLKDKFRYLIPILRKLGACKTLVDGSLESPCRLLINCNRTSFSISYRWHATRQNVSKLNAFWRGWVSLSQDFRGKGSPSGLFFGF